MSQRYFFSIATSLFLLWFLPAANLQAQCTSDANGLWGSSSTWTSCGGGIPGSTDDVVIDGEAVQVSGGSQSAASLTIQSGGTLVVVDGNTLTISGNVSTSGSGGIILDDDGFTSAAPAPGNLAIGGDLTSNANFFRPEVGDADGPGEVIFNGNTGTGSPQIISGNFNDVNGSDGDIGFISDITLTGNSTAVRIDDDTRVLGTFQVGESSGTSPTLLLASSTRILLDGQIDNHGTFNSAGNGRLRVVGSSTLEGTEEIEFGQYNGFAELTVNGNLRISLNLFDQNTNTFTIGNGGQLTVEDLGTNDDPSFAGNLVVNGTLSFSDRLVINGDLQTGSGATLTPNGNTTIFRGGTTQTITGNAISLGPVTVEGTGTILRPSVPLTITGDLSVSGGATLDMQTNDVELTLQGTSSIVGGIGAASIADLTIANGANVTANGGLSLSGNLAINGSLNTGTEDILLNGSGTQTISGNATSIARLELDNAAGAELNSAITITDELTLTDGTFTTNSTLTLPTLPDGGGNTIDDIGGITRAGGTLSGNVTLERRFGASGNTRGTQEDEGQWRQISTPSNSINFSSLTGPFFTQGHNWAENPDGDDILFSYDPGSDSYSAEDADAGFASGTGYFLFVFENDLNNPSTPILPTTWSLSATENMDAQSPDFTNATDGDFVMAGNPFFGFLDWDAVHGTATDVNSTYQVWNPNFNNYQSYTVGGASVTNNEDLQYIPPAQGFWVEVNGSSPSLTFNKSDTDKPDGGDTVVYQSTEAPPLPFIVLNLEGNDRGAGLAMHFRSDSGSAEDPTDATWLTPFGEHVAMWSEVDGERFAVDNRPELSAGESEVYKIGVTATESGEYMLTWPKFNRIPGDWTLTLKDTATGTTRDMRIDSEYTFTIGSSTTTNALTVDGPVAPAATPITQNATSAPRFELIVEAAPLPVELTRFDATTSGTSAVLEWSTASETNNSGFYVQQKQDGVFVDLGFVEGAGTTNQPQSYRFRVDDLEEATEHTFRLKQVDLDGSENLTEARSVRIGLSDAYRLTTYPNPFQDRATVEFAVREAQPVTIELYNTLGQRVKTLYDGTARANETLRETINAGDLSSGLYIVRMKGERITATRKITVVR